MNMPDNHLGRRRFLQGAAVILASVSCSSSSGNSADGTTNPGNAPTTVVKGATETASRPIGFNASLTNQGAFGSAGYQDLTDPTRIGVLRDVWNVDTMRWPAFHIQPGSEFRQTEIDAFIAILDAWETHAPDVRHVIDQHGSLFPFYADQQVIDDAAAWFTDVATAVAAGGHQSRVIFEPWNEILNENNTLYHRRWRDPDTGDSVNPKTFRDESNATTPEAEWETRFTWTAELDRTGLQIGEAAPEWITMCQPVAEAILAVIPDATILLDDGNYGNGRGTTRPGYRPNESCLVTHGPELLGRLAPSYPDATFMAGPHFYSRWASATQADADAYIADLRSIYDAIIVGEVGGRYGGTNDGNDLAAMHRFVKGGYDDVAAVAWHAGARAYSVIDLGAATTFSGETQPRGRPWLLNPDDNPGWLADTDGDGLPDLLSAMGDLLWRHKTATESELTEDLAPQPLLFPADDRTKIVGTAGPDGAARNIWVWFRDGIKAQYPIEDLAALEAALGPYTALDFNLPTPAGPPIVDIPPTGQKLEIDDLTPETYNDPNWVGPTTIPSTFTSPEAGAVVTAGAFSISGQASAPAGVATVNLALRQRDNGLWGNSNGLVTTELGWHTATLDAEGSTTTGFTLNVNLPPGRWLVAARVVDNQGASVPTNASLRFETNTQPEPPTLVRMSEGARSIDPAPFVYPPLGSSS